MTIFAVVCAGMFPLIHVGRPWLGYWLFPIPLTMNVWPQFRSPLALGRLRGLDLRHHLGRVLVHRHDSRLRHLPRSRQDTSRAVLLRHLLAGAGAARSGTGCATKRPRCCSPASQRLWCSRYTPSSASTSQSPSCPAGTPPSSRPTSSPAPSTPDSRWCSRWPFRCASSTTSKHLVTERHIDNMGKVMLATGFIVAYGYGMEVFMAWYSASPLGSLHVLEPRCSVRWAGPTGF